MITYIDIDDMDLALIIKGDQACLSHYGQCQYIAQFLSPKHLDCMAAIAEYTMPVRA